MRGSCKCSCRHAAPLQVCGSSGSTVITPAFITPLNIPRGCSDVLSHPLFITPLHLSHPQTHLVGVRTSYHTRWFITPPLGPPASCTLSPGVHKISPTPQDTTPGDNTFESQSVITGVCYLVSVTVGIEQDWRTQNCAGTKLYFPRQLRTSAVFSAAEASSHVLSLPSAAQELQGKRTSTLLFPVDRYHTCL